MRLIYCLASQMIELSGVKHVSCEAAEDAAKISGDATQSGVPTRLDGTFFVSSMTLSLVRGWKAISSLVTPTGLVLPVIRRH